MLLQRTKAIIAPVLLAGILLMGEVCMASQRWDPKAPPDTVAAERALTDLMTAGHMGITVPIFDEAFVFKNLWWTWPDSQINKQKMFLISEVEQKKIVYSHYGIIENPANPELPLGFVKRGGFLAMNCLACHAGRILGQTVIGLPNRYIDFRSLYEDIGKLNPLGGLVLKIASENLGPERGLVATMGMEQNALKFRDRDMNLTPVMVNWGDFSDALAGMPPWWNISWKTHAFADAAIPLTPRIFVTSAAAVVEPGNFFRGYEQQVTDAFELAKTTRPPVYPAAINFDLARDGKMIFDNNCAHCHGHYDSYGEIIDYPNKIIPMKSIGTDPLRAARTKSYNKAFNFIVNSWVAEDFSVPPNGTVGYLAPPLKGVWSTAPYLHNGSVPTLWSLLNPEDRPGLWKLSSNPDDYDLENLGVKFSLVDAIPPRAMKDHSEFSLYYDTKKVGRSANGHTYSMDLTPEERRQVLEYLKLL